MKAWNSPRKSPTYTVPPSETTITDLANVALDLDMTVTSFFASFGLLDRVDIGVVLPIVSTSLRGTSDAEIIPFGGPTAAHFWGGTPSNPQLSTSRLVQGSATGMGDVAARIKIHDIDVTPAAYALERAA